MLIDGIISFSEAQSRERALLASMADAASDAIAALVWRTEKAIVVPRGMPSRENFAAASAAVEALGFPVFERDTGGDLTPQSPGVVNLSLAFRLDGANAGIAESYGRLTGPVIDFLKSEFGIEADVRPVPGAFCDGKYNIAAGGLKLGGTAQRWKLLGGEGENRRLAVLSHVAILCDADLPPAIEALNVFYQACGINRHIELDRHATLAELAGAGAAQPERLAAALAAHLGGGRDR